MLEFDQMSASRLLLHSPCSGFSDLTETFQRLEENWGGWSDVREWESLEGDLRIEARHQFGHVQLRVTVRRALAEWGTSGWSALPGAFNAIRV